MNISDLLGKVLGSGELAKILPSLGGIMGNGEDNFISNIRQGKNLFKTQEDFLAFCDAAYVYTTGTAITEGGGGTLSDLMKLISSADDFVQGIPLYKKMFTREQSQVILGQLWMSVSPEEAAAVQVTPPVIVVEENEDPVPTPVPTPDRTSAGGNEQGIYCFYGANANARAKAFAAATQSNQQAAKHKICPTYPNAWYCRVGCFTGGCQCCFGLNTWVNSQKIGPCDPAKVGTTSTSSTCTDGSCSTNSSCTTGDCPAPTSTCTTGTCSSGKSGCSSGKCSSGKTTCNTGKCPAKKKK